MSDFKFYIDKNVFCWEGRDFRIEFLTPSIQASDEYRIMKSEEDIMYFYYTIKLYKKVKTEWDDEKDEWNEDWSLIDSQFMGDFPAVQILRDILNEYLDNKIPATDGQMIKYNSGTVYYQYTLDTSHSFFEDYYEVSRLVKQNGKEPSYSIYFGVANDMCSSVSSGIKITSLNTSDIKELLNCVQSFIEYSIEKENIENVNRLEKDRLSKFAKNNKLYNCTDIDCKKYESIFIVGDRVSGRAVSSLNYDERSIEIRSAIKEITEEKITMIDGNSYEIGKIIYLYKEVDNEKIYYGIKEIAADFLELLDDKEKREFKKKSVRALHRKYSGAIIDRTAMCRDEHNLPKRADTVKKSALEHAKDVIEEIKLLLES